MRDDDLAAVGVTAGGNECRAAANGVDGGGISRVLALVEPGNVVLGQFYSAIQGYDVPDVELDSLGLRAFGDAFDLLLIFCVNVRPEHLAAGLAKELPVALGVVSAFELDHLDHVFDLAGKQTAVLISDLRGCAFEMNESPAAMVDAITRFNG